MCSWLFWGQFFHIDDSSACNKKHACVYVAKCSIGQSHTSNAITDISLSISYSQTSITYKFVGYYFAWVALLW